MKYLALLALIATPVFADAPVVEDARIDGNRIYVTVSHPDEGWNHYADGWEVLDAAGNQLGFRELLHPHVNEQPFTRSLSGVTFPTVGESVFIRTRDNVHGWSEALFEVPVTK